MRPLHARSSWVCWSWLAFTRNPRPDTAARPGDAAARDEGRRHRSAGGLGGGRPLPARDGRVESRPGARWRSAAPTATARSGSASACARPAATSPDRVRSGAREQPPPSNIRRAGLADIVTVVAGDAFKEIPKMAGDVDFVFLDAWKRDYKRFLDLMLPRMSPGGLFLAHNVVNKQERDARFPRRDSRQSRRSSPPSSRRRAKGCRFPIK